MPELTPTCETQGHLWDSAGKCIMCKIQKPKPPSKLKAALAALRDKIGTAIGENKFNR